MNNGSPWLSPSLQAWSVPKRRSSTLSVLSKGQTQTAPRQVAMLLLFLLPGKSFLPRL